MKKAILILLVSLGLQTQAQINYAVCDSMTASGSQVQLQIEINGVNTFIDYWCTNSTCGTLLGEDSMSLYHTVYNSSLHDTIITCITWSISTSGVTNTCCVTWGWNGMSWANMMVITSVKEIESKITNNKMYDLYGREILKPKGLYIKNNKLYYDK